MWPGVAGWRRGMCSTRWGRRRWQGSWRSEQRPNKDARRLRCLFYCSRRRSHPIKGGSRMLLAHRLAEYAGRLRFQDLPKEVVHEATRRFIDSFATAVGAMDADAYAIAKRCAARVQ